MSTTQVREITDRDRKIIKMMSLATIGNLSVITMHDPLTLSDVLHVRVGKNVVLSLSEEEFDDKSAKEILIEAGVKTT